MREAMLGAEVGDDEYRLDPTVERLQDLAAARLRKEAALLVPSGTMANAIAAQVLARPFDSVLCEESSACYQAGHFAAAGVDYKLVRGELGSIPPERLRLTLELMESQGSLPRFVSIENTANLAGGIPHGPSYLEQAAAIAASYGVATHMDGARLFNAAAALRVDVAELAFPVDSLMFCLSKGLGAPVGSMLVGTESFIASARRVRKRMGGQMRQAGVFAAAGIVALEQMTDRLVEDHRNARLIAEALAELPGLELDLATVQTNMVWFGVAGLGITAFDFVSELEQRGIAASAYAGGRVRLVTHCDIGRKDVADAIEILRGTVTAFPIASASVPAAGMTRT
jgi:threonine aldolase